MRLPEPHVQQLQYGWHVLSIYCFQIHTGIELSKINDFHSNEHILHQVV